LVEEYAKAQGMWRDSNSPDPEFTATLELDMSTVESSIAGPKRPQDRITLSSAAKDFKKTHKELSNNGKEISKAPVADGNYELEDGSVVIASITSCTNTSNPSVMLAAGLVAKKAIEKGITVKPWVKTSLAPGSKVVTDYLKAAELDTPLDALGFNLVGYGCMTCIGNSGPLPEPVSNAIDEGDLVVCSVLSGNRNFEGRINPQTKANYLASPPLVVAYALAGSLFVDLLKDPLGEDKEGNPVYLKDVWPTNQEVQEAVETSVQKDMFINQYGNVFEGSDEWRNIPVKESETYDWDNNSTYVKKPPFFEEISIDPDPIIDIKGARPLAILGDTVTTDHISPAGAIKADGPAGRYLQDNGIDIKDFNSFGSRRGNHEVMMRGTFANIRLRNEMVPGSTGGVTRYMPNRTEMSIYDAAMRYYSEGTPLIVVAGKEYGTGSSRDWAAKGTRLLGVRAVIAESFERIHRSNLIGMGVLPLQFKKGDDRKKLNLTGCEKYDIVGIEDDLTPGKKLTCHITYTDGSRKEIQVLCRIDTLDEIEYYKNGGILHYVLRNLCK
jgi:aconitate hydratase